MGEAVVCSIGCCGGCQDCYGYSIGCHQDPCRCDRPCSCDLVAHEMPSTDCERHNMAEDTRRWGDGPDPDDRRLDADLADRLGSPCPECGETGACAWDAEGRPLIHAQEAPNE